jgi:hypothetical protein
MSEGCMRTEHEHNSLVQILMRRHRNPFWLKSQTFKTPSGTCARSWSSWESSSQLHLSRAAISSPSCGWPCFLVPRVVINDIIVIFWKSTSNYRTFSVKWTFFVIQSLSKTIYPWCICGIFISPRDKVEEPISMGSITSFSTSSHRKINCSDSSPEQWRSYCFFPLPECATVRLTTVEEELEPSHHPHLRNKWQRWNLTPACLAPKPTLSARLQAMF